ncbi:hypothetical protein EOA64_26450 [Mesorhizobium sp. M1A.F.Ca.IN.022.02.1.1]|uniref:dCTP deaminase domain-containing protein n=1 Tax=Mesorhizobium sp. M1A.F.Ca.IN.022.02.1.1 TaxID=2496766 RepID=UPI000FCAA4A8|nr:hypothetical protein [Mesorhizobium sp. M1A.F.Ca.IN.022.02.1.1]RUV57358.1 hypothetical protein EOA64_26450 [Mesorhizobium sp. M1A.F.Ca.IN.022.02.1.1]
MKLLAADDLNATSFFSEGRPLKRGSSFELTVGVIVDQDGNRTTGPYVLKPGEMVQVVSKEVFRLPDNVTGHVTYKTALTRHGIWALTVGIVDPGWEGPIGTTLLNFSKVDFPVDRGQTFLRVTLFKHAKVPPALLPKSVTSPEYIRDIQKIASTEFPRTFLNSDAIAKSAGDAVMARMQKVGIAWITVIAAIFTVIQIVLTILPIGLNYVLNAPTNKSIEELTKQVKQVDSRLDLIEGRK